MRKQRPEIYVHATRGERSEGAWRAWTTVGPDIADAPGVLGAAADNGPWIEAFGDSPLNAFQALIRRIGEAYIEAAEWEARAR